MPLLSSYLKVKSIFPWPVIPDSVIRSKLLGHDPSSPGTRFAASMPFSQATQGKRPVDHWLSSSSRRGSSQSSPPSKALEAPKKRRKNSNNNFNNTNNNNETTPGSHSFRMDDLTWIFRQASLDGPWGSSQSSRLPSECCWRCVGTWVTAFCTQKK